MCNHSLGATSPLLRCEALHAPPERRLPGSHSWPGGPEPREGGFGFLAASPAMWGLPGLPGHLTCLFKLLHKCVIRALTALSWDPAVAVREEKHLNTGRGCGNRSLSQEELILCLCLRNMFMVSSSGYFPPRGFLLLP